MAKGVQELISDFRILHPKAYNRIRVDTIDGCYDLVMGLLNYYRREYNFGVNFNILCNSVSESLNQYKIDKSF